MSACSGQGGEHHTPRRRGTDREPTDRVYQKNHMIDYVVFLFAFLRRIIPSRGALYKQSPCAET